MPCRVVLAVKAVSIPDARNRIGMPGLVRIISSGKRAIVPRHELKRESAEPEAGKAADADELNLETNKKGKVRLVEISFSLIRVNKAYSSLYNGTVMKPSCITVSATALSCQTTSSS